MEVDRLPEWERVVPAGVRFAQRNGGDVVLSCIDFWSDRVTLHFGYEVTTHPLTGPGGRPRIGPGWSLADDLGTPYRAIGGGGGGGRDLHFGSASFSPAPAPQVQWLYISSPELLDPIEIAI